MKSIFSLFARNLIAPIIKKFFIKKVRGEEFVPRTGGLILAPNHQSYFDHFFIPYLVKKRLEKVRFIGKMDSKWQALQWGWFYWIAETIPVNRKAEDRRKVLQKALEVLKKEGIIIIYPEGTRNKRKELLRGKTGVAELAIKTGVPVVPVGLIYRNHQPPSLPVSINVGQPLYFRNSQSPEHLREITNKIMKEIAKLSEKEYPY